MEKDPHACSEDIIAMNIIIDKMEYSMLDDAIYQIPFEFEEVDYQEAKRRVALDKKANQNVGAGWQTHHDKENN